MSCGVLLRNGIQVPKDGLYFSLSFAIIHLYKQRKNMLPEILSTCPHDAQYGEVNISIEKKDGALAIAVETARLRILSVNTDQYTPSLIDLYGSKKVMELVGSGETLAPQQVAEKIARWKKRWSENNPFSGYVVVEKATGDFVGQIILKPFKDKAEGEAKFIVGVAEIGYLSAEKHWKKKYAQEYAHAMIHHLLPQLILSGFRVQAHPITSVLATTSCDNLASNGVLRKFMTFTGTKERYGGVRQWYEHRFLEASNGH